MRTSRAAVAAASPVVAAALARAEVRADTKVGPPVRPNNDSGAVFGMQCHCSCQDVVVPRAREALVMPLH